MKKRITDKGSFINCVNQLYEYFSGNFFFTPDITTLTNIKLDVNFFNNNFNFYSKLLRDLYILNYFKIKNNIEKIKTEINKRNSLLFLKYLKALIDIGENDIYKRPEIKLSISIMVDYLCSNYGKKIINSTECFHLFRKEIEILYGKKFSDLITKLDNEWIEKGKKELKIFKEVKIANFEKALIYAIDYYKENKLISQFFQEFYFFP